MSDKTDSPANPTTPAPIVARPTFSYRVRYGLVCGAFFAFGLLCVKDGFYTWPSELAEDKAKLLSSPRHGNGYDIPLQQGLAIFLPVGSLLLFLRYWVRSRGQYVLEGNTITVPGHPPVPLERITAIDKRRLERKGVAMVDYELADGRKGQFALDDVFYDRKSTDQILKRIEFALTGEEDDDEDDEEE